MEDQVLCLDDLINAPDIDCDRDNVNLITGLYYANPGHPLTLVVALDAQETVAARYTRELLRRVGLPDNNPARMRYVKVHKGTMPLGTPATRTNPNTGTVRMMPAETPMRIEGTDYRDNPEMRAFWKGISSGTAKLFYPVIGNELITGEGTKGLYATVTAANGVIDGTELTARTGWGLNWNGHPIPDRVEIVV